MQQTDNKNLEPSVSASIPDPGVILEPRTSNPEPGSNLEPRTSNLEPASEPRTSNLAPASPPIVSLVDYLIVIARQKKMILLTTFGAAIITAIYTLTLPNIYTATTMILASEDDKGGMGAMMAQLGGLAGIGGGSLGGPTKTDLYISMLKSETVKDSLIDRFKLMDVYKAKFRSDIYNTLDSTAKISAGKKDGIITIAVSDKDPKQAAEFANGYVEELGRLAVRLSMSGAGKSRLFLEERMAVAKADLAKAGDELKAFQARNKVLDVSGQAKVSIDGIAQLRAQLAAQEVQLATLQRQFTETSQEVKRTRVSVENLKVQISRLEGNGGVSSVPSLGSVPQLGQEYLRLMREFKIQETLVELLTKQYEMAKLSESKDLSPFQVLQKAKVPERKSKPVRSKMVIIATFVAFFSSMLFAFAREGFARMPEEERKRWKLLRSGLSPANS